MGKASAPPPPDYRGAAEETAASNKAAAEQQMYYNRPDQYTPFGSQEWSYDTQTDPTSGEEHTTATQTSQLAPEAQRALDAQLNVQSGRSEYAQDMLGTVQGATGTPFDYGQYGDYQGLSGQQVDPSFQSQRQGFTPGDPNALRQQELARMQEYAAPQREADRSRMETQLANQGLTQGSEAYNNAMRQRGDAEARQDLGFQMQAGAEAQRAQAMGGEQQRQGAVEQQRDIMGQQFGMGEQQRQGYQQGQDIQGSNYANNLRQMQIAEGLQGRQIPLNEMNALLTGQQVGMPQMPGFMGAQNAGGTDYTGAARDQYQGEMDIFNTQQASKDAFYGGLMSMGSSAAMMCDIRVKRNLEHVGYYEDDIPQYAFQYIWSDEWFVGPVAQEVEEVHPELVFEYQGVKHVNMRGLGYAVN